MTDRQTTLFEELEELRAKLEKRPRVRLSTLASIDALLARHRESERWHYPAEGEVPKPGVRVLAFAEPDLWAVVAYDHERRLWETDCHWTDDPGRYVTPTRWRYLSPADVPEAP